MKSDVGGLDMKKLDIKSLAIGFIIGTVGITTAFAANGIKSADLSTAKVTLDGAAVPLTKPLVAVTADNETDPSLYMPVGELLEYLGYTVTWDGTKDTVHLVSNGSRPHEIIGNVVTDGNTVMNLSNKNAFNISESGSFQAEDNQVLTLNITSTIKGGSVDLFLFDPNNKEQRITIGSADAAKEIALSKGIWQYNCSGMFNEGGNIRIVGTVK